jgi:hypothetical protein
MKFTTSTTLATVSLFFAMMPVTARERRAMKTEAEIRTHMESLAKIGPVDWKGGSDRGISDSYFRWVVVQSLVAVLRWVLNDDPPEGAAKR